MVSSIRLESNEDKENQPPVEVISSEDEIEYFEYYEQPSKRRKGQQKVSDYFALKKNNDPLSEIEVPIDQQERD